MPWPTALACLLALATAGCAGTRPSKPVQFSSSPPGALVLIDGQRSGFATPCLVALPLEKAHRIEFELPGYEIATRYVVPAGMEDTIFWREMNVGHRTPRFPLFLNIDDFFVTILTRNPSTPSRIFVRMRRSADLEADLPEEEDDDERPGGGARREEGSGAERQRAASL